MNRHQPLDAQERELAARLAEWKVGAPPPRIEQAILAQARAAAATAARTKPARRPPWLLGLASAAVLTLAVGVAWRVLEAPPEDMLLLESLPVADEVVREKTTAERPAAAAGQAAPAMDVRQPVEDMSGVAASSGVTSDAERREAPPRAAAARPWPAEPAQQSLPKAEAPVPPPVPAPAMAPTMPAAPPPPPPLPPSPPLVPAPVVAAPAPATPPAFPAPPPGRTRAGDSAAAAAAPAPAAPVQRQARREQSYADEAAGEAVARIAGDDDLAFGNEVTRIRELLRRGERDEALPALERLQRRFPQKELPADLKALLDAERNPDP